MGILMIIALVLSVVIVNFLYKMFMSIIGANVMFFNPVTKIICYVVVWMLLIGVLGG